VTITPGFAQCLPGFWATSEADIASLADDIQGMMKGS
jgi:hypothetical protein